MSWFPPAVNDWFEEAGDWLDEKTTAAPDQITPTQTERPAGRASKLPMGLLVVIITVGLIYVFLAIRKGAKK